MPRDTTDVEDVNVVIEEEQRSVIGALRASWQLWAVALAVTFGAVVSLTTEITGPMDEFLFTTLAVAAVAAALTRTASRAGNA